jgi:hypothetical protein
MAKVCPVGFFCFNTQTILLIFIFITLVTIYVIFISNNYLEKGFKKVIKKVKRENFSNGYSLFKDKNRHPAMSFISDPMFLVDKDHQRIVDPLEPPERAYPYRLTRYGLPVNIPTRGYSADFQQVGVLKQKGQEDNEKMILPLFGAPTWNGSKQWRYYTSTDDYQSVKLSVHQKHRNCMDDMGCDELYDGSEVKVDGLKSDFIVSIYHLDTPKYLPYIY